jgi:hypothetical protein
MTSILTQRNLVRWVEGEWHLPEGKIFQTEATAHVKVEKSMTGSTFSEERKGEGVLPAWAMFIGIYGLLNDCSKFSREKWVVKTDVSKEEESQNNHI